ncbi:MAG: YfiR family protein [Daejeonella sp.]
MKLKKFIFFFLTSILVTSNYSFRISQPRGEYNLKAAFLYRFLDYIEWDNKYEEPVNIAVLGESDIYRPLLDISRDRRASKVINVRLFNSVNEIGNSQVVFISRHYKYPIEAAIAKLDQRPALIISEEKGDLDKGSHINFLLSDNKLKFEINLSRATGSGFKIGSKLLRHALVIKR